MPALERSCEHRTGHNVQCLVSQTTGSEPTACVLYGAHVGTLQFTTGGLARDAS
jgi:hypothetical protein